VQFVNYCYRTTCFASVMTMNLAQDEEAEHAIVSCIERIMVVHPACTNGRQTTVASGQ